MSGKENQKPTKSIFKKPKGTPQRVVKTYTENEKAVKFDNVLTECGTPFTAYYISKKLEGHSWFTSRDTLERVSISSQILSLFEMSNGYVLNDKQEITNTVWRTGNLPLRFLLLPGVIDMKTEAMDDLMRTVFVLSLKMLQDQSYRVEMPLETQIARVVLMRNVHTMNETFTPTDFEKSILEKSDDYKKWLAGNASERMIIIDDFITIFWSATNNMDARLMALEEYLTVMLVRVEDGGVFFHFPNQLMWMLSHYMNSTDHSDADKIALRLKINHSVFLKDFCLRLLHTIEEQYNDLIAGHLNAIAVRFMFNVLAEAERVDPAWNAPILQNALHFRKHKELTKNRNEEVKK